ncbi:glycosyltransferase family 2 protein [Synechococcus sp. N5]|uniref:glycosyltransferase family 2 protein n=1 Tax=Synechococcus sp. N5 TaxID=2575515 RepID=UPI000E0F4085|nr:glycosyltransferase family 2 protein [Synechococcus sp. N5]
MSNPVISIAITTFNRWTSCLQAVRAVSKSTYKHIEIILVDDASSDSPPTEIFNELSLHCAKFIRHPVNMGLASARNTALEASTGDYFSFCDDDDIWPSTLAEAFVRSLTYSDANVVIALPKLYQKSWYHLFPSLPTLKEIMYAGVTPPVSGQAYRSCVLKKIGGYNPIIKSGVDHDLWISLTTINPLVSVAWGIVPITNTDSSVSRLTTLETSRRQGISHSLEAWQPLLTRNFSIDFYIHFCMCYQQYLDFRFLQFSIQRSDWLNVFLRFYKAPYLGLFCLIKVFKKYFGYRTCNQFKSFQP